MLQLLQDLDGWCEDLPPLVQTPPADSSTQPLPTTKPPSPPPSAAAVEEATTTAAAQAPGASEPSAISGKWKEKSAVVQGGGDEDFGSAAGAAAAAMAAVSLCSSALDAAGEANANATPPAAAAPQPATALPAAPPPAPPPPPPPPAFRAKSEARNRLEAFSQSLACSYLAGEVAYVACAVRMAADLSEVDTESLTLSLVDDAFFVLLKAFSRGVTTGHALLAVIPLLHAIVSSLRTLCLPLLQKRLRFAGSAEAGNSAFVVAVNSMQCADEYTAKLKQHVASSFSSSEHLHGSIGMAEVALAELDELAAECREAAQAAIRRLAAELLPLDWLRVDFEPASFELQTEAQEAEAQRSFEVGLLQPLQSALEPLLERLRPSNVETLVHTLAAGLAEQMEKSVLHKKFNEVGAMLLCEHTRKLVDALSTLVSGSVRNDFAHLNQIAFLLNAGSVQEAASLLLSSLGTGAGDAAAAGSVRLTRSEAARVLALRSDLSLKEELRDLFEGLDEDDDVPVS